MKLAVVVQRYGLDINGGAELHARYISEHLARHVDVEVLTTCATDYITWRNDLSAGEERLNDVVVRRFPVRRERDPGVFGRRSHHVFGETHSWRDELAWLEAEGASASVEAVTLLLDRAGGDGRQVLTALGRPEAGAVTPAEVADHLAAFGKTPFNGDGLLPVGAVEDPALAAVLQAVIDTRGGIPDCNGDPCADKAGIGTFFADLEALLLPISRGTKASTPSNTTDRFVAIPLQVQ